MNLARAHAQKIIEEIQSLGSPEQAEHALRFFKTAPGQYGHGDKFLGVSSPQVRKIVRKYKPELDFDALSILLNSSWHEVRFFALAVLVEWAKSKKIGKEELLRIADFYLSHSKGINNWDLVDISAPWILGPVFCDDAERLWALARSENLWLERMSLLATHFDIRRGRFGHTLALAEYFLPHKHDLMHKAAGWMLREVGKRDEGVLLAFLDAHASKMPRTMFRYAVERLT